MAAYEDKSALETAIDNGRMEIWNIMREGLELSETDKLQQLCRMIVAGKMEQVDPSPFFSFTFYCLIVNKVFGFRKGDLLALRKGTYLTNPSTSDCLLTLSDPCMLYIFRKLSSASSNLTKN